jgi:O-antigen ligase
MELLDPTAASDFMPVPSHDLRLRKCFLFLVMFTIAIYARPEDLWTPLGHLHLTFLLGVSAGLGFLGTYLSGRAPMLWSRELVILFLLSAWYATGVPFSFWRGGSLDIFSHVWLKTLFVFFLLTQTLVTVERIRKVLWAIILSELAVTSVSILFPSRAVWVGERMLGVNQGFLGWNFLGIAAAMTFPYMAALFVASRSLAAKAAVVAAFATTTWTVVLTASRGGLLGIVFSMIATFLLVLRGGSRGRVLAATLSVVLAAALAFAPDVIWQRLSAMWDPYSASVNAVAASASESEENRLAVLQRSVQYTLEHPVFGLGLGNFEVVSGTELRNSNAWKGTHNTFTEMSSEAGIPAFCLFVALLSVAISHMVQVRGSLEKTSETAELRLMAGATLASLLSFSFGAFFAHIAYEYYLFYPVAVAVGLRYCALRELAIAAPPVSECLQAA